IEPTSGPSLPSRPGEFHPEPLTDPDLSLSTYPARATARRLPPSIEHRVPPLPVDPSQMAIACSLRSTGITLLRSSPSLAGASFSLAVGAACAFSLGIAV